VNNKGWKYELKNNNGATLECCKEQRYAAAAASILFSSNAVTYLQNNYVTRTARERTQVFKSRHDLVEATVSSDAI